ncbi:MAG: hypothetical protein KDD62_05010 [Bdellovibrionales bacterium]|nr:hypothetical protein [Bdellovibrionales bacterium]
MSYRDRLHTDDGEAYFFRQFDFYLILIGFGIYNCFYLGLQEGVAMFVTAFFCYLAASAGLRLRSKWGPNLRFELFLLSVVGVTTLACLIIAWLLPSVRLEIVLSVLLLVALPALKMYQAYRIVPGTPRNESRHD